MVQPATLVIAAVVIAVGQLVGLAPAAESASDVPLPPLAEVEEQQPIAPAPAADRSDDEIKADVEAALAADPYTTEVAIDVSVEDGVVELAGEVDSRFLQQWAYEVAGTVPGVDRVTNRLLLSYVPPRMEDWEMRDKIQWRLGWSPFVDADTVAVTVVDGGVAILTGTARDKDERRVAAQNAAKVATRKVIDRLRVRTPVPIIRYSTRAPRSLR
jgi:osmotically-inducible protein OsmY